MKTTIRVIVAAFGLAFFTLSVQAEDYTYETNNGTITITGYTGPGGAVDIPGTINGLPVTCIGCNAFSYRSSLTSVTIPNSVTSIGCAFYHCIGLTNVTIPNSVTNIENGAFSDCTGLTSVDIPNSVTSIGDAAFENCTSLTAITVEASNPVYSSVDGVLFNKTQTTLIQCPGGKAGSYTIPDSVTSIRDGWVDMGVGGGAFSWCTSLTSITIPDSVTNIGVSAFYQCIGLTSVTLGKSVTSIGAMAFSCCTSLTSVTIPNSVTSIGGHAFRECTSLTSITIPNSVTSIEVTAFGRCTSLTSITIPNSVTSIGGSAFTVCSNLTSVTIGNGVTSIGGHAFYGCGGLTGVCFRGDAPSVGSDVFLGDDSATVYYLPGTLGWGPTFGGRPTALWKPQVETSGASFGVRTNRFGFNINWASGMTVVVEASTSLVNPAWSPVSTNTLTDGWSHFSDPQWTNYPARFYRIRSL